MKLKIYIILALCFFVSNGLSAQDKLEQTKFKISNSLIIGSSKSSVISTLGAPDQTSSEYWEISDKTVEKIRYNLSLLYFYQDKLERFDINDSQVILYYNGVQVRVGNLISSISSLFPNSYARRTYNNGANVIIVMKKVINGQMRVLDEFIDIEYNRSNNRIVRIKYGVS